MMLQDTLCAIRSVMIDSGLVNEFYELAEPIQRGGVVYPAYYDKGGQYLPVHDFDVNGAGYMRKRSDLNIQFPDALSFTGCDDDPLVVMTYPMRMVAGVPKAKLGDSAYSDDRIVYEIISILGGDFGSADITVRSASTDALKIWANEVNGIDYQMIFTLSYVSIDFDLVYTIKQSCIKEVCGYGY